MLLKFVMSFLQSQSFFFFLLSLNKLVLVVKKENEFYKEKEISGLEKLCPINCIIFFIIIINATIKYPQPNKLWSITSRTCHAYVFFLAHKLNKF